MNGNRSTRNKIGADRGDSALEAGCRGLKSSDAVGPETPSASLFRERLARLAKKDAYSRPRWTSADIKAVESLFAIADAAHALAETHAWAFIGWEPAPSTEQKIDAAFDRLRRALGEEVPDE